MTWYPLVKWVHILSSTVLFGTGAGIAFFWPAFIGVLAIFYLMVAKPEI
jgi:uncharacterized membrane protein